MNLLAGIVLFASMALAVAAQAAEITFVGIDREENSARFRLEGEIKETDVAAMKAALKTAGITHEQDVWRKIIVELDSPGGSYLAGLDLALLFRRQGLATEVRSRDMCYSACALAFLGGTALPKDPTPPEDDGPIPNQPPDRSIGPEAKLGFHAPYLDLPESSYTAQNVGEAYTAAVLGIARFIAIADHLYISTAELPALLKPTRDDFFMVDNVDAVGFLGIGYNDSTMRGLSPVTRSMIFNACINRYYHLQRRSSLAGYSTAISVMEEFVEGSKLLGNGEENLVFGVRRMKRGSLAFMPIAKTYDDKSFVWCLFGGGSTFYKPAGTVEELFEGVTVKDSVWDFSQREPTLRIGENRTAPEKWMLNLDMVLPNTKLTDVSARIVDYQTGEEAIPLN